MYSRSASSVRNLEVAGIEITRACNLRCPHCFTAASRRPKNELTSDEIRGVLDQMIELGPPSAVGWTGGEPLLCDHLDELIDYAYRRGKIRSGITTNGLLLDIDRALRLRDAGSYAIQISVDGSTPARFAAVRAADPSQFRLVLEAMNAVKRAGMQLHLAMVLGKKTLDDARAFIRFAADNGATGVRFCGFVPAGRGRNAAIRRDWDIGERIDELREFIEFAQTISQPIVMFDPGFGPLPPDFEFHECIAGINTVYISSSGSVYPCTALIDSRFEIGNIRERELKSIWEDPKMTEVAMIQHDVVEGRCSYCSHLSHCHGGCRGTAFIHSGTLTAECPNCLHQMTSGSRAVG